MEPNVNKIKNIDFEPAVPAKVAKKMVGELVDKDGEGFDIENIENEPHHPFFNEGIPPRLIGQQIEDIPNMVKGPDSVSKFFSKLFEARQMAHIFHLQVNGQPGSGWEHKALDDFYTQGLELIDDIIETYQGQYGIVEGYEMIDTNSREYNSLKYLQSLVEFIKIERYNCLSEEDSHLQNIVDEIIALSYKTIYKLSYLK